MKLSKISFWLCTLVILYSGVFFYPRWQHTHGEAQISWDASGYYWYLPSLFIYQDIKGQAFKDSIIEKYQPTPPGENHQAVHLPSGQYVMQYSAGMALLELPFFTIAHLLAPMLGYPADGFSFPYQFLIFIGGTFFSLLGIWKLRKLLLYYYNETVTAVVLFIIAVGSNYLNYSSIDAGMCHTWLFTLYVFIMLNTRRYYITHQKKYLLRTAALIAIATLVRPTEIMTALLPLLWGLQSLSFSAIKERLHFIISFRKHFILAAITGALILAIQLCYWKYATGNWIFYTYGEQGFVWLSPLFRQYTFNFECGWLIYTPVMLLVIPGIFVFLKKGENKVAISLLILVNYYIVCSWQSWNIGGRAMIQSYPLLAFPLASLIQVLSNRKTRLIISIPLLIFLCYFNLWWTYQAHKGGLMGNVPGNWPYFKATALRYTVPEEVQKLRDNFDLYRGEVQHPTLLYTNTFSLENGGNIEVGKDTPESDAFSFNKPKQPVNWIRASADIYAEQVESNVWYMTHFIIRFKKQNQVIKECSIRLQRFLHPKTPRNITVDAATPQNDDYDAIEILFRNENNGEKLCVIDNLKVIGFNNQ